MDIFFRKCKKWLPGLIDIEIAKLVEKKFQNRIEYAGPLKEEIKTDGEIEALKLRRDIINRSFSSLVTVCLATLPVLVTVYQFQKTNRPVVFVDNVANGGIKLVDDACNRKINVCYSLRINLPILNKGKSPAFITDIGMQCENLISIGHKTAKFFLAPNQSVMSSFEVPGTILNKPYVGIKQFSCKSKLEYLGDGFIGQKKYLTGQSFDIEFSTSSSASVRANVLIGGGEDIFE